MLVSEILHFLLYSGRTRVGTTENGFWRKQRVRRNAAGRQLPADRPFRAGFTLGKVCEVMCPETLQRLDYYLNHGSIVRRSIWSNDGTFVKTREIRCLRPVDRGPRHRDSPQ